VSEKSRVCHRPRFGDAGDGAHSVCTLLQSIRSSVKIARVLTRDDAPCNAVPLTQLGWVSCACDICSMLV
jgi:hypothetical protein